MLISKVLSDRRAGVEQLTVLRRQNQILRRMLPDIVLPAPAENILIVVDVNHFRLRKLRKHPLSLRIFRHFPLHINMGKRRIIIRPV